MPVRKQQIPKFLWIIRTSQIRKILLNTSQLCLKPFLIVVLSHDFFIMNKFNYSIIFCKAKNMYLRTCRNFKSAKSHKDLACKLQIRKVSHLQKVRKYKKFADIRFADLPPLAAMLMRTLIVYCIIQPLS
jgi:hypothetical protein